MKFTEYLAVYAAILSTIALLWNVAQARARIRVDMLPGVDVHGVDARHGVYVVIRNISSHDAHLAGIDVLYRDKAVGFRERIAHMREFRRSPRTLGWVHVGLEDLSLQGGCPLRLEPRKAHRVFIPEKIVARLRSKSMGGDLMAHVQDQLWNDYYSRVLTDRPSAGPDV